MRQILVERSDWFVVDASDAVFINLQTEESISGEQWLNLNADEQSNYAINTVISEQNAIDGETQEFNVSEHKEND